MRTKKRITALAVVAALLLSMVTVASAAETKTFSLEGTDLFSVTNIDNSFIDSWEEEGITYHDEVLECTAPVTVTVLNGNHEYFEIMDHTYEIMNENERDAGFIMPDGCPGEKEYWEGEEYSGRIAEGTTYTLTEPGTYGVNMWLGGETYYYVAILIDGERTREGDNFTKAYYHERAQNSAVGTVPEAEEEVSLNQNLVSITNLVKQDGFLEVENQNTGEVVPLPVYSCLVPAEVTAAKNLAGFELWELAENEGPYFPWVTYRADDETEEAFAARNENGTPAGTKYTITGRSDLYYLYASDGSESINAVLRIDGAAPIDINKGTTTETYPFWEEIPNGSATISGVYDITYDGGAPVYVIDRNSTITYNSYLDIWANVGSDTVDVAGNNLLLQSPICTPLVYETISYEDNTSWYDLDSDMMTVEQIAPGMTVQFNTVGRHYIQVSPGYASRDERIAIQHNENSTLTWQWSPTIAVWVIDPAPRANYTASKVIVDGVQTEFEAYNINDNNYFKLRDIAMAISGTQKQFGVYWDGEKNAISLMSGHPYTPVGGELEKGDGASKDSVMSTSVLYKDDKTISLGAYNISGNNYFKLRDLGEAFDFDVSWDADNNCIMIDTAKSYTAD